MTTPNKTKIAIVGGGPVGLLLAAELGQRGVPTVLLTEGEGTSTHPKANTHGARSMEIYRRHGFSDAFRAASPSRELDTDVGYFTRLMGHELHRVKLPSPRDAMAETREANTRWPTPEPQFRSSQLVLEPLLLDRVKQFASVDIRFGHRVTDLAQQPDHVDVRFEHAGGAGVLRADYVVGCDGGRSLVRRTMGVRLLGEGGVELEFMGGRMVATYFRAPGLAARKRHAHAWQNWFILPHVRALMLTLDPDNDLYLLHYQLPLDDKAAKSFQQVLDEVMGTPTEAEVISSADWKAGISLVAEKFRSGRCFVAGDAAHLFTPTGGFGVNTGIEDAFNLGWKLAGVSQGWADEALLDTYEPERKPVAERNTAYALVCAKRGGACPVGVDIEAPSEAGEASRALARKHLATHARWEFDTPGIQLGFSYRGSSGIVDDGSPEPPDDPTEYVPNAVAGHRLPHVWLSDGVSLYDQLGPEFTLIDMGPGTQGAAWIAAAADRDLPLKLLRIQSEELKNLAQTSLLLVRPDQMIAWRGDEAEPGWILDMVTGRSDDAQEQIYKKGENRHDDERRERARS